MSCSAAPPAVSSAADVMPPSPRRCRPALLVAALLCLATTAPPPVQGGICWAAMVRHGRCTELVEERVSREQCCANNGVATAWSPEDLDAGTLFFWRVLGGGVHCHPCKESCSGVVCGPGKKCLVRKGRPKCVCAPHCRAPPGPGPLYPGPDPVCGTDGRTYRSVCKLKKRACRKNNQALSVAYHGACQSSCDRTRCPGGKYCLLDQNLTPHCVRCTSSRQCKGGNTPRPVCGTDRRTYHSPCHVRQAACRRGKAIPIAYKGKCMPGATCDTVRCSHGQLCLTEWRGDSPRCVSCPGPCLQHRRNNIQVCGSNNRTYTSWCHMIRDACDTGYVIETQSPSLCLKGELTDLGMMGNTVLGGKHS